MENPYVREGLIEAGGHSPNRLALATRNSGKMMNLLTASRSWCPWQPPLTRLWPGHISAASARRRKRLFCLSFLAV